MVYVDDILIFTFGLLRYYKVKVYMVLGKLREIKLILNINKYQFEKKQVKYLGFIIEAGVGLRIDLEKIRVIWECELFKTKKRMRAFLGFVNYYKAFINKFVTTVASFMALIRKYSFYGYLKPKKPLKI